MINVTESTIYLASNSSSACLQILQLGSIALSRLMLSTIMASRFAIAIFASFSMVLAGESFSASWVPCPKQNLLYMYLLNASPRFAVRGCSSVARPMALVSHPSFRDFTTCAVNQLVQPGLDLAFTTSPSSTTASLMATNDRAIAICKSIKSNSELSPNMTIQTLGVSFDARHTCVAQQLETVAHFGCTQLKGIGSTFAAVGHDEPNQHYGVLYVTNGETETGEDIRIMLDVPAVAATIAFQGTALYVLQAAPKQPVKLRLSQLIGNYLEELSQSSHDQWHTFPEAKFAGFSMVATKQQLLFVYCHSQRLYVGSNTTVLDQFGFAAFGNDGPCSQANSLAARPDDTVNAVREGYNSARYLQRFAAPTSDLSSLGWSGRMDYGWYNNTVGWLGHPLSKSEAASGSNALYVGDLFNTTLLSPMRVLDPSNWSCCEASGVIGNTLVALCVHRQTIADIRLLFYNLSDIALSLCASVTTQAPPLPRTSSQPPTRRGSATIQYTPLVVGVSIVTLTMTVAMVVYLTRRHVSKSRLQYVDDTTEVRDSALYFDACSPKSALTVFVPASFQSLLPWQQ